MSVIFDILEPHAFQKYCTLWDSSALYYFVCVFVFVFRWTVGLIIPACMQSGVFDFHTKVHESEI